MAMSKGQGVAITRHRQEPDSISTGCPSRKSNRHRDWSINGPQLVSKPAQVRLVLFRLAHDLHDLGITGVRRAMGCGDAQRRFAIDRARYHRRTVGLGDFERFARQIGFVHQAVTLNDRSIDGRNFMWIDDDCVAHRDVSQRHVGNPAISFHMGD